jgi:hypothetical protein
VWSSRGMGRMAFQKISNGRVTPPAPCAPRAPRRDHAPAARCAGRRRAALPKLAASGRGVRPPAAAWRAERAEGGLRATPQISDAVFAFYSSNEMAPPLPPLWKGELTIGGIDKSHYTGELSYVPLLQDNCAPFPIGAAQRRGCAIASIPRARACTALTCPPRRLDDRHRRPRGPRRFRDRPQAGRPGYRDLHPRWADPRSTAYRVWYIQYSRIYRVTVLRKYAWAAETLYGLC